MSTLTDDLREAFLHAEKHRRAAGFGTRSISEVKTTRADGTVWIGPKSYKWTGYFMPWDYLDIIRGIENSDRPDQSMTRFIKTAVKEKCDRLLKESQHSARPAPRKTKEEAKVVPIRRPRNKVVDDHPAEKRAATG
jgi:hypothetical protein